VTLEGVPQVVREGDKFADDDPIVRAFPELFVQPVEQATANPGEIRNVRRRG
jgi:hypothetical protein